jgi:hypothetical protein
MNALGNFERVQFKKQCKCILSMRSFKSFKSTPIIRLKMRSFKVVTLKCL